MHVLVIIDCVYTVKVEEVLPPILLLSAVNINEIKEETAHFVLTYSFIGCYQYNDKEDEEYN